jgi:hypothetical protein
MVHIDLRYRSLCSVAISEGVFSSLLNNHIGPVFSIYFLLFTLEVPHGNGVHDPCRHQSYSGSVTPWLKQERQTTGKHSRPEFLSRSSPQGKMWSSPSKQSAWSNSPVRGITLCCWPFLFFLSIDT